MTLKQLAMNKWAWTAATGLLFLLLKKKEAAAAPSRKVPIEFPFISQGNTFALYDYLSREYYACVDSRENLLSDSACAWAPRHYGT